MNASEVAEYLIAYSTKNGDSLSNLKLNKLLYYAQAWHLAIYDESLFTDPIEAWESGPVVPAVYQAFERAGHASIKPPLNDNIRAHLEQVIVRYFSMTDDQLDTLTREEIPWILARKRIAVDGALLIKIDEMKIFHRYASQDMVTRAATFSCRLWASVQRAFSLSTHLATFYH